MTLTCYECGDELDPDDANPITVQTEYGPQTAYVCPEHGGVFAGP